MDLKDYIATSEKHYPIRIKTVVPLDDEAMDIIEMALQRYLPIEISRASKTMLQSNPLDFINVSNAEVWIVDVILGMPATPTFVRQDIRMALHCPEDFVVVRLLNEPIETYTEIMAADAEMKDEAAKRGLKPGAMLSTGKDYPEYDEVDGKTLYGDAYNSAFLAMLKKVEDTRVDPVVKATNALFDYIDTPDKNPDTMQDDTDYNASLKDVPEVPKVKIKDQSLSGSVHDAAQVRKRIWQDAKGKTVEMAAKKEAKKNG